MRGTLKHSLESFCGDRPETLKPIVYCDADFAGDTRASKSTNGSYIALAGPNTSIPIASLCKKQTVVSHSSTESEIISMEIALRSEAIPILSFWDLVVDVFDPPKTSSGGGTTRQSPTVLQNQLSKAWDSIKSRKSPELRLDEETQVVVNYLVEMQLRNILEDLLPKFVVSQFEFGATFCFVVIGVLF